MNITDIKFKIATLMQMAKVSKCEEDRARYLSKYKEDSLPYYPVGLSKYNDKSLAFGFKKDNKAILFVYNMNEEKDIIIPLKKVKSIKLIYPLELETKYEFKDSKLIFNPYRKLIARVFELELDDEI